MATELKKRIARENGKKSAEKLRKQINPVQVEKLAAMHSSVPEIAAVIDCSRDTLDRRFADVMAKGRENGRAKLRHLQWKSANAGNVTMQIWLGKQLLHQTDKHELAGAEGTPLIPEGNPNQLAAQIAALLAIGKARGSPSGIA